MENKKIHSFLLALISLLLVLFSGLPVNAAELYLQIPNSKFQIPSVGVGQQFQIDVILNTEGESINAVEGKIVFPAGLSELKEIRDGNSIISFWVERPSLDSKSYILYSGIIPGGYLGNQGLIFSAIFQAKEEGNGIIEIAGAKALINDGKGTETKTRISIFEFRILKSESPIPDSQFQIPLDADPPEEFTPQIAADPAIFNGKWFLVFATQDKGSGIDHYEAAEFRSWNLEFRKFISKLFSDSKFQIPDSRFQAAESPHLLKDQKLKSYIYVKAIDKAGNERIAVVEPRYPLRWYEYWQTWAIIILGLIVAYLVGRILWSKHTKIH